MIVECVVCGHQLDTEARTGIQYRVTGWAEKRKGGGANKIVDRQPVFGEWRHSACAKEIPQQEQLAL